MGERIRALWERLKADFHKNPALWIGLGISAAILVIAWLAYRKGTGAVVPANGYGFPDYGGASGGSGGGLGGGGYAPYQPPGGTGQPIPSPVNPFPAPTGPTSSPFPVFPPFSFGPPSSGGGSTSAGESDTAALGAGRYTTDPTTLQPTNSGHGRAAPFQGIAVPKVSLNNPLALAQQAHRGSQPVLPPIQNPLAPAQQAHRGVSKGDRDTASLRKSHPRPPKPTPPPTTLRPAHSGHGRVA